MRRMLILLVLTTMTANSVGCCCCRGLRDWLFQGSPCSSMFAGPTAYAPATYAPAYAAAPTCGPTYAPAYAAAPMAAMGAPQYAMPQYTMAAPMATSCGDPCSNSCSPCSTGCSSCSTCGASYGGEVGCGTPVMGTAYMSEPSCSYSDGAGSPTPTAVYPSPAAE